MAEEAAPLNYERTRLVELLQEKLKERDDERAAEKAKRLERNQTAVQQLLEAMEVEQFLINIVTFVERNYDYGKVDDKFAERVKNLHHEQNEPTFDQELKRLIRVYENADDEKVQVSVTSDVYRYI